jgi:hypothetical protein
VSISLPFPLATTYPLFLLAFSIHLWTGLLTYRKSVASAALPGGRGFTWLTSGYSGFLSYGRCVCHVRFSLFCTICRYVYVHTAVRHYLWIFHRLSHKSLDHFLARCDPRSHLILILTSLTLSEYTLILLDNSFSTYPLCRNALGSVVLCDSFEKRLTCRDQQNWYLRIRYISPPWITHVLLQIFCKAVHASPRTIRWIPGREYLSVALFSGVYRVQRSAW